MVHYPESGTDAIVIGAQGDPGLADPGEPEYQPPGQRGAYPGERWGGKASNIICGDVQCTGTLRTLSEKTRDMLKKRIPQLAAGIAQGMGGNAEVRIQPGYGAVYNNDALYAKIEALARDMLGADAVVRRGAPAWAWRALAISRRIRPGCITTWAAAWVRRCIREPL